MLLECALVGGGNTFHGTSSSNKPVYQSVVIELAICPIKMMADDHWGII